MRITKFSTSHGVLPTFDVQNDSKKDTSTIKINTGAGEIKLFVDKVLPAKFVKLLNNFDPTSVKEIKWQLDTSVSQE